MLTFSGANDQARAAPFHHDSRDRGSLDSTLTCSSAMTPFPHAPPRLAPRDHLSKHKVPRPEPLSSCNAHVSLDDGSPRSGESFSCKRIMSGVINALVNAGRAST